MILHGLPLSPFVRKVMFMLNELGLDVEQKMVPPQGDAPDFRAASPLGRIPAFEDGDIKLSDSSAICHYLALTHYSPLMGRTDAHQFAQIVWYDKYADEDLAPPALQLLVERVVKRIRYEQPSDEVAVATIVNEKLPPVLDVLDGHLAASGDEWFVGDQFSFADMAVAAHLSDLPLAGIELDAERWPALAAWFERALARPSIAKAVEAARRLAAGE